MNALKRLGSAVMDNWIVVLAILVNLGLASPAAAGWDNDVCYQGGKAVPCCSSCSFFCTCDIEE
jgi:hypothetical protein